MSTILDALRKSEQERKLNKLPTLTDMAAPQEPSRWPLYIGLALVLLAIALVVLAYVIWSAKPQVAGEVTIGQTGVQANNAQPTSADEQDTAQATQSNIDEVGLIKDTMLVNVVSYSKDPAYSFAMVNGKMVREGDFIEPGLKLEKILPDAVVFNSRGEKITRSP
ncbi:MAG: general secretion pathway protein GspB [Arenicella sp.]|nr:general secretion pathway protein GspB [Arenicella sp.]